jgi:hypothetical protein
MSLRTPQVERFTADVPSVAQAATASTAILECPFAGTVTAVSYAPVANITGVDTNTRTFTLVNKGADGNGTTVVATRAMVTGVNATDFNEDALTLSVVAGATTVAEGDILAWVSTFGATGIADPGGLVQVDISRT